MNFSSLLLSSGPDLTKRIKNCMIMQHLFLLIYICFEFTQFVDSHHSIWSFNILLGNSQAFNCHCGQMAQKEGSTRESQGLIICLSQKQKKLRMKPVLGWGIWAQFWLHGSGISMNQPSKVQIPEGEGGRKGQCAPKRRNKVKKLSWSTVRQCRLVPYSLCHPQCVSFLI